MFCEPVANKELERQDWTVAMVTVDVDVNVTVFKSGFAMLFPLIKL